MVQDFFYLLGQTLWRTFSAPYRPREIIKQMEFVVWQSLPVVLFSVSSAAVVTIIESSFHMRLIIQNDSLVPGFAAMLILRELGAVVSALLVTSRVGAGFAAEIATMKITEQIDALKMLGIDPVRFLVVPKFIACTVGGFLISILANMACLYCAILVGKLKLGHSFEGFISSMGNFIQFRDLIFAAIKGFCFGAVIPLVSCFYGFRCRSGAEGVGLATTNAVVTSSVVIIIMDFSLSWFFSRYY
ncbi:MAG: ABC transporter permease [Bdellovibrionales bacterium]|nr:ABC transporter permease [Bdellovibrionales bacterium]